MAVELFANQAATTLNGTITSGASSLVVTSATAFPTAYSGASQFRIIVESEIMLVTATSGTTFTITRAQEGTSAAGHNSGVAVTHIVTAASATGLQYGPVPIDSNTLLYWPFDEAASPYVSKGSNTLSISSTGTVYTRTGIFGSCMAMNNAGCATSGDPTSSPEPTYPITMSAWYYIRTYSAIGSEWPVIIGKNYHNGTWSTPYANCIQQSGGTNGVIQATIVAGTAGSGTGYPITSANTLDVCQLNTWYFLAVTYDGTTVSLYINGALVASTTVSSPPQPIDWGPLSGGHGGWYVGGNAATTEKTVGYVDDVRVETVARSAAYLLAQYHAGKIG